MRCGHTEWYRRVDIERVQGGAASAASVAEQRYPELIVVNFPVPHDLRQPRRVALIDDPNHDPQPSLGPRDLRLRVDRFVDGASSQPAGVCQNHHLATASPATRPFVYNLP
jgi:hypothetical protein